MVKTIVNAEYATEVAKIVAHANTKSHMTAEDDEVPDALIRMLIRDNIIPENSGAFLEWQGAFEFGLATIFYCDERAINVYNDGLVEAY